jgi:hypothetical protein
LGLNERIGLWVLKKSPQQRFFICEHATAGFLICVRLSGSRQNWCCRLTEEAYESLDVLCYGCQEELLAYKLQSA